MLSFQYNRFYHHYSLAPNLLVEIIDCWGYKELCYLISFSALQHTVNRDVSLGYMAKRIFFFFCSNPEVGGSLNYASSLLFYISSDLCFFFNLIKFHKEYFYKNSSENAF